MYWVASHTEYLNKNVCFYLKGSVGRFYAKNKDALTIAIIGAIVGAIITMFSADMIAEIKKLIRSDKDMTNNSK